MSKHILNFSQWMELKENRRIEGNLLNENEGSDVENLSGFLKTKDLKSNAINSKNYSEDFRKTLTDKLYKGFSERYKGGTSYGSRLGRALNVALGQYQDVLYYTDFYTKESDPESLKKYEGGQGRNFKQVKFTNGESSTDTIIKTIFPDAEPGTVFFVMEITNMGKETGIALKDTDFKDTKKELNFLELKFSKKGESCNFDDFCKFMKVDNTNFIKTTNQVKPAVEKFASVLKSGELESNIPLAFAKQFQIVDFEKEPVEKQLATLFGVDLKKEHTVDGIKTLFKKDTTIQDFAQLKKKR